MKKVNMIQKFKVLGIVGLNLLRASLGLACQQSPDPALQFPSSKSDELFATTIVMGGDKNCVIPMVTALKSLKENEKYNPRVCIFVDKSVSEEEKNLLKGVHPNVEIRLLEEWIQQQETEFSKDFLPMFECLTSIVTTTLKGESYAQTTEFDKNPFRFIALRFFYPMIFFENSHATQVMSLDFDKVFNRSHEEALNFALSVDQPVLATPRAMMNFSQVSNKFPFISSVDNFNGGLLIFNRDAWFRTLAWIMQNLFSREETLRHRVEESGQENLKEIFSTQVWPILEQPSEYSFSKQYLGLIFLMYCLKSELKFDDGQKGEALRLPLKQQQDIELCHIFTEERFFFEIVSAYCRDKNSQTFYLGGQFNANSQRDQIFCFVSDLRTYLLNELRPQRDKKASLEEEIQTIGTEIQQMSGHPVLQAYCARYASGKRSELVTTAFYLFCNIVGSRSTLCPKKGKELVFSCQVLCELVSLVDPKNPKGFVNNLDQNKKSPFDKRMQKLYRILGEAFLAANSPLYLFKNPDTIRENLKSEHLNVHFDHEKKPWAYNVAEELSPDVAGWYEHFQRVYSDLSAEQKAVIQRNCLSVPGIGSGVKAIVGSQS